MKDCGVVCGSKEQAKELIVGKDTVYVHTNIEEATGEKGEKLFQYHEIQYDKDEYIELMGIQNKETNDILNTMLGVMNNE